MKMYLGYETYCTDINLGKKQIFYYTYPDEWNKV